MTIGGWHCKIKPRDQPGAQQGGDKNLSRQSAFHRASFYFLIELLWTTRIVKLQSGQPKGVTSQSDNHGKIRSQTQSLQWGYHVSVHDIQFCTSIGQIKLPKFLNPKLHPGLVRRQYANWESSANMHIWVLWDIQHKPRLHDLVVVIIITISIVTTTFKKSSSCLPWPCNKLWEGSMATSF